MTVVLTGVVSCGSASRAPEEHLVSSYSTRELSLAVANPTVTHVALGDRWLAYTEARSGVPQDFPNQVVAVDLTARKSRVVARSAWPKGQSDWVVVDGDWVFWNDQSIAGADDPQGLRWTIRGEDLRTGTKATLARNTFDSPVPLPVAGGGRVLWAQQARPGAPSNVLQEFVIRTGKTHQLATIPAGWIPDQLAIGRDASYFDAVTSDGTKSDVWRVGSAGTTPRPVTTTGRARGVVADPGSTLTAWSNGTTSADPTSFTVAAKDRPDRTVRSGVEYDLHIGSRFASYFTQQAGLRIVPNGSVASRQIATKVSIPCRTAVFADRIAYCTQSPTTGRITLRIDRFGR